ncbi:MAG TPA: hypothetical protein VJ903_03395 [Clostridia bacterium]|nr:hypothetical protein [Clostridia bacterium]
MKYLTLTFDYLFKRGKGKHFLVFSLFALLPSAVLAYFFPASDLVSLFANYNTVSLASYGSLWLNIYSQTPWSLTALICTFVLSGFCHASICSIITRHFRVNDFSIPKIFHSMNENFFPAITVLVFVYLLILIVHSIGCLFIFLWFSLSNKILGLVLAAIFQILSIMGAVYIKSALTLWLPIMSFNGLPMRRAISTAFYKSRSFQKQVFVSSLIPILFSLCLCIGAYFVSHIWYISWILNTIAYLFSVVVIITLDFVTFCEVEGVSREDLLQSPYKRR